MHSKDRGKRQGAKGKGLKISSYFGICHLLPIAYRLLPIVCFFLLHISCLILPTYVRAEVIDRVVAYVDETAVTLSELQDYYLETKKTANITEEEALNSMINRSLLLKEARAMKLEAHTDDELMKDYIDIKIGALILIKEDTVISFYNEHLKEFKGQDYLTVRDTIEKYLFEAEINRQLKKHLEELRAKSEVRIWLTDK